ncbi:hypothetical protein [Sphingopyxis sp. MWB1]|jgi:hypothetical protein|uniref:hypothetical protein n=1 Tax=Sphingopyxis sp. MWB1 TaxID=1537715 RepID=UPI00051A7D8C|nr:hypothetical protein [Sphingopyxis sp. MWB1]
MPVDTDPAADAAALVAVAAKLDLTLDKSPRWGDWNITGPASEHRAMLARFRADHPMENLPWGYCPP